MLGVWYGVGKVAVEIPKELAERMVEWAGPHDGVEDEIRELIGQGEALLAAEELRSRMGDRFDSFIQDVFLDPKLKPGPAHELVPRVGFSVVLTTNYDTLIESA